MLSRCSGARAFVEQGFDALLRNVPKSAGLLGADVVGGQTLRLRQQVGHRGQLFFAVPSEQFFQGRFGLCALAVCKVQVVIEPPNGDLGQLGVAQLEKAAAT